MYSMRLKYFSHSVGHRGETLHTLPLRKFRPRPADECPHRLCLLALLKSPSTQRNSTYTPIDKYTMADAEL